jgi:hypothetical protein
MLDGRIARKGVSMPRLELDCHICTWRRCGKGRSFFLSADQLTMIDELLQILRSLWTEEVTEFDGVHFQLSGGVRFDPKPMQPPLRRSSWD